MIVYIARNKITGKVYIGITTQTLGARRAQHKYQSNAAKKGKGRLFQNAIRKYGCDGFEWSVLERCDSLQTLWDAERKWISHFDSMNRKCGYNRAEGGAGTPGIEVSQETRMKLSLAGKGRKQSAETRAKRSAALKGNKISPKCIESLKNRVLTPEQRKRWGDIRRGKSLKWSEKALENVRAAARKKAESGVCAVLKPWFVDEIKARREAGDSYATIAADYGVRGTAVLRFCRRHGVTA